MNTINHTPIPTGDPMRDVLIVIILWVIVCAIGCYYVDKARRGR
mgnify:CR=1 FL=1